MSPGLGIVASGKRNAAAGLSLTYQNAAHHVEPANTTKTFAGVPIGAAGATRTVLAMVSWWAAGSRSLAGVTCNGVAMNGDVVHSGAVNAGWTIWSLNVPTGLTADIAATFQDSTPDASIAVWTSPVLLSKYSHLQQGGPLTTTSHSIALTDTPVGGKIIAGFATRSSAFSTTWNNLTERFDFDTAQPFTGADGDSIGGAFTATFNTSVNPNSAQGRIGIVSYAAA